jgi:hypothetical protein
MHPLLRTLDLTAIGSRESSVHDLRPIRDAASERSRGIPLLLSLGLTPLLIYVLGLSLIQPSSMRALQGAIDQARRSVTLVLHEPDAPAVQASTRNLAGPEGPGGAGHREGTNTLDPRLVVHTAVRSNPSDAIDPDELNTSERAERVYLSLNPELPPQAGGNGLTRGSGRNAASGQGGLKKAPVSSATPAVMPGFKPIAIPDFKLVPIRKIQLNHQMSAGEEYLLTEPAQVRILIGEDGVPFQAALVSGSPKLQEKALRAALGWRFEPLGPHGLKAPLVLVITFRRPH